MRQGLLLVAIVLGLLARVALWPAHDAPRGDVLLDVGVARSLEQDRGFASGFERGTALVRGDRPVPPQDRADQHPPLWPLAGAALARIAASPFAGLKLGSLLCGLLLLLVVWRQADRLTEGCVGAPDGLPALAAALVAMSFVMIDYSVNGSLYVAQACLVVLLVGALSASRPSAWRIGVTLGAAWILNYQAAVLLAVPPLVLLIAPPDGRRLRALLTCCAALLVAAAVCAPWWWRNQQLFGDPFYSVNTFYPLYKAGLLPSLGIEAGVPVARMPEAALLPVMLAGQRHWLPPNALYLLATGLMLWPGLLALVGAGLGTLLLAARRGADRRLLATLACLAVLAAVALAWPGMKLRYLVPMTPLVVLLGVRVLAAPPGRGERRGAWLMLLVWLGALLVTLGDVTGAGADARPERWWLLLGSGAIFLALPLLLRHRRLSGAGLALGLCSGALIVPALSVLALLRPPHTAYHSSVITPDAFGQAKEQIDDRRARTVALAREAALADGAQRVMATMEWAAYESPALRILPMGAGELDGEHSRGDDALVAWIDRGDVDHVFTFDGEGWTDGLVAGDTWLEGRLEVVASWTWDEAGSNLAGSNLAGASLSRVTQR